MSVSTFSNPCGTWVIDLEQTSSNGSDQPTNHPLINPVNSRLLINPTYRQPTWLIARLNQQSVFSPMIRYANNGASARHPFHIVKRTALWNVRLPAHAVAYASTCASLSRLDGGGGLGEIVRNWCSPLYTEKADLDFINFQTNYGIHRCVVRKSH